MHLFLQLNQSCFDFYKQIEDANQCIDTKCGWTQFTNYTRHKITQRFLQRKKKLVLACKKYGNSSMFHKKRAEKQFLPAYWPVSNTSVRYCPIEKTGSTTWNIIFHYIERQMKKKGIQPTGFSAHLNPLSGYTDLYRIKEAEKKHSHQDEELSFMFVREPYSRLLSAYVDKLFCPNTKSFVPLREISHPPCHYGPPIQAAPASGSLTRV